MILAVDWLGVGVGLFQELIRGTGIRRTVDYYWLDLQPRPRRTYSCTHVGATDAWLVLSAL